MKNKEFISIIIPYHRKKKFFQETIDSICNQTFKNIELLVVYDDTDKSELEFVKKTLIKSKLSFNLIVNFKNIGVGKSRNKALKKCKGNFVAFCDADDLWIKDKLKFQINFMKKKKLSFSYSSYNIINSRSKKIGLFMAPKIIDLNKLMKNCDIGLSTVMIKKDLMNKFSFSSLRTKEDYLLWLEIINKIKYLVAINRPLVKWRKLEDSLSSSVFQKLIDAFKLYHIHRKKNFLLSVFFVIRLSFYAVKKKILMYW